MITVSEAVSIIMKEHFCQFSDEIQKTYDDNVKALTDILFFERYATNLDERVYVYSVTICKKYRSDMHPIEIVQCIDNKRYRPIEITFLPNIKRYRIGKTND